MREKKKKKKINISLILILILSISTIIMLLYIIFEKKNNINVEETKSENVTTDSNLKAVLPIYQCDGDNEMNGTNITVDDEWLDKYVNSSFTNYDCKIKYLYQCKFSLCYLKDSYGLGKYKIIYDNNKENNGGYYLIDVNYNKTLIGPYKSMIYLGNMYDRKLLIQDKETEKFGIYSTMSPRETLVISPEYDYIGHDYIATKNEEYYLLESFDNNPSKFDMIYSDQKEINDTSSILYTFVKNKKMNMGISDKSLMFKKWFDVLLNMGKFESEKHETDLYIAYVENNKLHFAYTAYNANNSYYDLPNGVIDINLDKEKFYSKWLEYNINTTVQYEADVEQFQLNFIYDNKIYNYLYDFNEKKGNTSIKEIDN